MMSEKVYRARHGVNKSTLWELRKSPAHYKYLLEHPREDTPAMKIGRATHTAILRPRAFQSEFAVIPEDIDRRTKAGKAAYAAFEAKHPNVDLITVAEMEQITAMKNAVRSNSDAVSLLRHTEKEKAIFWTDPQTGIKCKCRMDAVKEGVCIDLKTTLDASTSSFTREALKRGYDVQAAHYCRGLREKYGWDKVDFVIIAVEKEPPYAVNVLRCSDGFIDRGTWVLMDLLDKLKVCRDTGKWDSYGTNDILLPTWAEYGTDD